jgi:hypothetical protein
MIYFRAALRTIAILLAVLFGLLALVTVVSAIVNAFLQWGITGGCLTLAAVFAIVALFGYQLTNVSERRNPSEPVLLLPRSAQPVSFPSTWPKATKIGVFLCLGFGALSAASLIAPLALYVCFSVAPLTVNKVVGLFARTFGTETKVESVAIANLIFWPFIAYPVAATLINAVRRTGNVLIRIWTAAPPGGPRLRR